MFVAAIAIAAVAFSVQATPTFDQPTQQVAAPDYLLEIKAQLPQDPAVSASVVAIADSTGPAERLNAWIDVVASHWGYAHGKSTAPRAPPAAFHQARALMPTGPQRMQFHRAQ